MKPGEKIGRYRLESILGRGGMGEVFLAFDEMLHRQVAVKVLVASASGSGNSGPEGPSPKRIVREARIAAGLRHPNIVAIFDVGEGENTAYIVMEHVRGASLRQMVGRDDVPAAERVRWLVSIASALAAAHRQGLVHRDIKPDNVLLDEDGTVKVLDFGIARREQHDARVSAMPLGTRDGSAFSAPIASPVGNADTHSGTLEDTGLAGTPAYMAPEQVLGGAVDARADQFAWGVTAYEVLTGHTPWIVSDPSRLFDAILRVDALPLDASALNVAPSIVAAIARTLEKKAENRFASTDDLLVALGVDKDRALPIGPMSTSVRVQPDPSFGEAATMLAHAASATKPRVSATRPRWAAAIVALAIVCVGVGVGLDRWTRTKRPKPALTIASPIPSAAPSVMSLHLHSPRRLTLSHGCQEYPSFLPDGRTVVFDASSGDEYHVEKLDVTTGKELILSRGTGWQWASSVSPDGATIAFLRTDLKGTRVVVRPIDPEAPETTLREGSARPSFTPDGRALWAGSATLPERFDLKTGLAQRSLRPPAGHRVVKIFELPDGRAVVHLGDIEGYGIDGLVLYSKDLDAPPTWITHDGVREAILPMPDGKGVVAASLTGTLRGALARFDFAGGAPMPIDGMVEATAGMSVSPGGEHLVWSTCNERSDITVLERHAGEKLTSRSTLTETDWMDHAPTWILGTSQIVVASDRADGSTLWAIDVDGEKPPTRIPVPGDRLLDPAVSADRAWIAYVVEAEGIDLAPMDGHAPPRRLVADRNALEPAFSRDGKTIYFETRIGDAPSSVSAVSVDGGPARVIAEGAARPAVGPSDHELTFVAPTSKDGREGAPVILDLRTGKQRPIARALGTTFTSLDVSPDGRRLLLLSSSLTDAFEIDLTTEKVIGRFSSAAADARDVMYAGDRIVAVRRVWSGGLWISDDPFK